MRLSSHQDESGRAAASRERGVVRRRPVIEEIEPRILYSADFSPVVLDAHAVAPAAEHRVVDAAGDFVTESAVATVFAPQVVGHEVVFVDTAVPDYQKLVQDITANSNTQHEYDVVLLNAGSDGIKQITQTLAGMHDVSAVHIISHGADGEVELGNATLNFDSLLNNAAQIKGWSKALAPGADLLIYGCDVAEYADGKALVDALSRLTGSNVAASEDLTGAADKGGNWTLEYQDGFIDTQLAVSAREQASWRGILDAAPASPANSAPTKSAQTDTTGTAVAPTADPSQQPTSAGASTTESASAAQASIASSPLAFEPNVGQTASEVDYLARGNGYVVGLVGGDAVLALQDGSSSQAVRLDVVGKNVGATAAVENLLQSKTNYLVGSEDQWRTDVANFGAVRYDNVYNGIDLRYYGNQKQLEYDFLVNPGASVSDIQLKFDGVQNASVADNGDLVLTLDKSGHTISFKAPVAYQDSPNGREAVTGHYRINEDGTIGFDVGSYDASRQLVIDPVLSYATYFGGTGADVADGVAVDPFGNFYVTGYTASAGLLGGLPLASDPGDVFVAKFSPAGSLIYSTDVGGSGFEQGTSIAVDASGNAYVTGLTQSGPLGPFPTVSAYQGALSGTQDAFVFKLNAAGNSLVYSTYLGGSGNNDIAWAIGTDAAGNAYVTGAASAASFPTTIGPAYGGVGDAFVAKLSGTGALVYSTFIGGSNEETAYGIAVDPAGNAVTVGETSSTDFPTTANAFQPGFGGGGGSNAIDGFVVKLNTAGSATYSSYLGGSKADLAYNVALDSLGKIYVTGETASSNFKTAGNALSTTLAGATDAFVSIIDPSKIGSASLVYSTYFGGSSNTKNGTDNEAGLGIGVYAGGRVYVDGRTDSTDFPTTAGAYKPSALGGEDAFFVIINPLATGAGKLVYGTYFGGANSDYGDNAAYSNGKFYLVGDTLSSGIATSGSYDSTFATAFPLPDQTDGFAAVFTIAPSLTTTSGSLAYVENDGARVLDGGALVSDPGIASLAGATLQITGNYANGEDLLAFTNQSGITGNWDGTTGTLTLSGIATVANYQAALRSVTYQDTSENPSTLNRIVTIIASDGVLVSVPATRQIAVTSVNDAPTLAGSSALTYTENQAATAINPLITVNDVDNTTLISATVAITSGFVSGEDVLGFANNPATMGNIFGLYSPSTGVLLLNSAGASATLAQWQAALQSVSYSDTSDNPSAAPRTVVYAVNDGALSSNSITSTVNVVPVNDAPTLTAPATYAATEQTTLNLAGTGITVGDVDGNGGVETLTLSVGSGVLNVGAGTTGATVTTGSGSTVTLNGTIAQLNSLLAGNNGATLSYINSSDAPPPTDTLTLSLNDNGNTGGGALGAGASATISVAAVNDPPVNTVPGAQTTMMDAPISFSGANAITVSDVDANGGLEQIALSVANGTLNLGTTTGLASFVGNGSGSVVFTGTLADLNSALNGLTYTPGLNYSGADALTVATNDQGNTGSGVPVPQTTTSTVSITVQANQSPTLTATANNPTFTEAPGLGAQAAPVYVFSAATDSTIESGQSIIGLTFVVDGLQDGANESIGVDGSTLTLGAASSGTTATNGMSYSVTLSGTTLATVSLSSAGGLSTADLATLINGITYQNTNADNPSAGTRVFTLTQIQDSGGSLNGGADTSALNIASMVNVVPVNDAPVLAPVAPTLTSITEDQTSNAGQTVASIVGASISDVDSGAVQGIAITGLASGNGTWQYSTNGGSTWTAVGAVNNTSALLLRSSDLVRFVPNAQNATSGSLTYRAWDQSSGVAGGTADTSSNGGTTAFSAAVDTASITVTAVNDAPVLSGANNLATINEDPAVNNGTLVSALIAGQVSDVDAGAVSGIAVTAVDNTNGTWQYSTNAGGTWNAFGTPTAGSAQLLAADANTYVRFVPNANWNGTVAAGITFRAWDQSTGTAGSTADTTSNGGATAFSAASASADIIVNAVNDAPMNSVPAAQSVAMNAPITFGIANAISVSDVDANAGLEQITLSVSHGTLKLSGTGGLTPVAGANGSASMTYKGTLASLNTALNGLTYNPASNYSGADTLSITSNDLGNTGSGGPLTSASTVGITVNAPAPPPVVVVPPPPPAPAPTPSPGPSSPPTPAPPTPAPPSSPPSTPPGSSGGSTPTGGSGAVGEPAQPVGIAPVIDQTPAQAALVVSNSGARGADLIRVQSVGPALAVPTTLGTTLGSLTIGGGLTQEAMLPGMQTETLTISSTDPEFSRAPEAVKLAVYRSTLGNKDWVGELNRMRETIVAEPTVEHRIVGSTVAVTGAMSVGYVIWLLRGGLLLSSLLSSLPAWHTMDPMPVLARSNNSEEDGEDDDPLENLFGRAKAAIGLGRSRPATEATQSPSTSASEKTHEQDEAAAIPA
jgi:hypothetical protein